MRTRALIVAAMVLLCFGVTPIAQDPAPKAADTLIERDYWLGNLVNEYAMRETVGSEPELCFYEDGTVGPVFRYVVENRYFRFADAAALDDMMEWIVGGKPGNWRVEPSWGANVRVTATEAEHAELKRAIEYWEASLRVRLRVELYQLKSMPERLIVAEVPEGATLIGRRDIPHGGFAVFSQLTKGRTTWMIENYDVGATPTTSDTYHGSQWAAGALLLPDGEIRVQAWLSQVRKLEGREKDTSLGLLELPAANWNVTSASATVPNGHGVVLQGEQHSYLLRVHTKDHLPHMTLGDRGIRLWNAAGCLPHGPLAGPWMLGPVEDNDNTPLYLPLREASRRLNFEGPTSASAAECLAKMLQGSLDEIRLFREGPLLMTAERPADPDNAESAKAAREEFYALMDTALAPSAAHELAAVLVEVPKGAALPQGVVDGLATEADRQALLALKDAKVHFQRRWLMTEGQTSDVAALNLQNYVSQLEWNADDDSTRTGSLIPGTFTQGVQVRVTLGHKGSTHVKASWKYNGSIREFKGDDAKSGEVLESPEASDSTFVMEEVTEDDQYACLVQPAREDTRVVLLVSRRRAR